MSGTADSESWTIRSLLAWTADFFRRKGSESPSLEAELLLAHVLGYERYQLFTNHAEPVGATARGQFRELVRRRGEGEPVAYLIGAKEFYSLRFEVAPGVLIPRPDSEHLVAAVVESAKGIEGAKVAEVGAGSGCLSLSCARWLPGAKFWASDISPEALAVARRNAERLNLADRVEFREGSLLAPLRPEAPFDVVLSNPPYIRTDVIETLDADVRDHEPKLALDGGPDGLRVIAPLIAEAAEALRPGGLLFLEIGYDQDEAVRALLAPEHGWSLRPTIADHAGHPRVIRATRATA